MERSTPQIYAALKSSNGDLRVVSDRVLSLHFDDDERKADKLTLQIRNEDLSQFDDPIWKKGGWIVVAWGYAGRMCAQRLCLIESVKGFHPLSVTALAKSVLMAKKTQNRTFRDATRSEVVTQIADEWGYDAENRDIEETTERFEDIAQASITDAAFLTRLAAKEGFEFYVDHTGFHWHKRKVGERPVREIQYRADATGAAGDYIPGTANVTNDITAKPGRTRNRSRNPIEGENNDEVADASQDEDEDVLSRFSGIFDHNDQFRLVYDDPGSEEERSTPEQSSESVSREARARRRRTVQTAVKMTLEIVGDPDMYAKTVVKLTGWGKRLSQNYWVQKVTTDIGPGGFKNSLTLVSDGHGGHSTDPKQNETTGLEAITGESASQGSGRGATRQEVIDAYLTLAQALETVGIHANIAARFKELAGHADRNNPIPQDVLTAGVHLASSLVRSGIDDIRVTSASTNVVEKTRAYSQRGRAARANANTQDPPEQTDSLESRTTTTPEGQERTTFRERGGGDRT